jgi:hypothetical protein
MFAEDLSVFFDVTDGFAETVTVGGATVVGIFDIDYVDASGFESSGPMLTLPSASCVGVANDTPVIARGVNYRVVEPKPDGTGVTVLRLHRS